MLIDSQHTIGWMLNDVSRAIRYLFDKRARALGVTRSQWRVLLTLARFGGITQTELADRLDVERISIGRMVDRLVESGLVERCEDPGDRRIWRLRLLPAAHGLVEKLTLIGAQLEKDVMDAIPAAEREQFLVTINKIGESVRQIRDEACHRKEVA